jgi:hypothetical protein
MSGIQGLKSRAECMIENYAARLKIGQCGSERNVGLKGPAERYAEAMERQDRILASTKVLLASTQLSPLQRIPYFRFALKLGKLVHGAWGERALRSEALILIMTRQSHGLDRGLMLRIAREVFGLELTEENKLE